MPRLNLAQVAQAANAWTSRAEELRAYAAEQHEREANPKARSYAWVGVLIDTEGDE